MKLTLSRKVFAILVASGLVLLGLVSMSSVYAQARPTSGTDLSVASLLNPNGTLHLRSDTQGTLDLAGWNVALDPQHGPILSRAALSGETWSPLAHGLNGLVNGIAVSGTDIYVVGAMTYPCDDDSCSTTTPINKVAKWDGTSWSPLGFGLSGSGYTIAVSGSSVYVGGSIQQICGNAACDTGNTPAHYIVRWDGTAWQNVGNGLDQSVSTLAFVGSDLYVGGLFTHICGNATCDSGNTVANHIAKWSGSSWASVGNGLNARVWDLAVLGTTVYAGGAFTGICADAACTTGSQTANRVAKWNGSAWSAVGFGVDNDVYAIAATDTQVFIGGLFFEICTSDSCDSSLIDVNYVAKWNGTAWSPMGTGGLSFRVFDLLVYGSDVYAGGNFSSICHDINCISSTYAAHIAKWNGSAWVPLTSGLGSSNEYVQTLAISGNNLYAGGSFYQDGSGSVILFNIGQYAPITLTTPTPTPLASPTPTQTPTTSPCPAAPSKPTLTTPPNQSTTTKARVTLKWNAAACATTYNVTVKAKGGGNGDSTTGLTATKYKTKKLTKGKSYTWFVQACNTNGCTKSKTFKFTLN